MTVGQGHLPVSCYRSPRSVSLGRDHHREALMRLSPKRPRPGQGPPVELPLFQRTIVRHIRFVALSRTTQGHYPCISYLSMLDYK